MVFRMSVILGMMAAMQSSPSSGLAYAQALEALTGREPSPRGEALRRLALELERLANHVGDLRVLREALDAARAGVPSGESAR